MTSSARTDSRRGNASSASAPRQASCAATCATVDQRTLVELDGAFGHRDTSDRWADLQRDLDASLSDHVTLRPGWAQVLEPCRLAGIVGQVLRQRGWQERVRPCRTGCPADGGAYGRT